MEEEERNTNANKEYSNLLDEFISKYSLQLRNCLDEPENLSIWPKPTHELDLSQCNCLQKVSKIETGRVPFRACGWRPCSLQGLWRAA